MFEACVECGKTCATRSGRCGDCSQALTYAKAGGPPSNWMELEVLLDG